jgi:branched-chain amino acid transport system permease protein
MVAGLPDIIAGGLFHAAVLFLVAGGLQLVFGVQKIVNLACGSFYALGAYVGITATTLALKGGLPPPLFPLVLIGAGLAVSVVGVPVERLLRAIYERDEAFQMLLTFALLLIFQDVLRFFWGATPRTLGEVYFVYGNIKIGNFSVPTYNVIVILTSAGIALALTLLIRRTRFGRILRATAENRAMAEGLGVDVARVYAIVFTLGTALGTVGGALVVPSSAAALEMAVELIVEAFAVVVIGGLGSMAGAAVGATIVGLLRAATVSVYPEAELLAIYVVVVVVLVLRPSGLFGRATA